MSTVNASAAPGEAGGPTRERRREPQRRTKSGCMTCRSRRIKCDENKPRCRRCIKSGKPCEGYQTKPVFRNNHPQHYQQNIQPQPAPVPSKIFPLSPAKSTYGSLPDRLSISREDQNYGFGMSFQNSITASSFPDILPPLVTPTSEPNSRNSSASNASGVSADSAQRRISVSSLISSDPGTTGTKPASSTTILGTAVLSSSSVMHRPDTADLRDNILWQFYRRHHARAMANYAATDISVGDSPSKTPLHLLQVMLPSLLDADPIGNRPLFEAVITHTAHLRIEPCAIDFEIRSVEPTAQSFELGFKALIDIMQGTAYTLVRCRKFFMFNDPLSALFSWCILQHTVVHIIADGNPRAYWVAYLLHETQHNPVFRATNPIQRFYVAALEHIASQGKNLPHASIGSHYQYSKENTVHILYHALTNNYVQINLMCPEILAEGKLEYLYVTYMMLRNGYIYLSPTLKTTLDKLMHALRHG